MPEKENRSSRFYSNGASHKKENAAQQPQRNQPRHLTPIQQVSSTSFVNCTFDEWVQAVNAGFLDIESAMTLNANDQKIAPQRKPQQIPENLLRRSKAHHQVAS